MRASRTCIALWLVLVSTGALAQDEAQVQPPEKTGGEETNDLEPAPNTIAGEFTPAKGFDVAKTKWGSLNLSFYGLVRYLNQLPAPQTFTDHLGRERTVLTRNDINWHR